MDTQIDPRAINIAKAIRQQESGGNYTLPGKSGEFGAYQFTPDTWNSSASKYGINVPITQATREQQNEVATRRINDWITGGKAKNVGEVASMWNAGEGEPNAYTGSFSDGRPATGTNQFGAKYDVPGYAKAVATFYQKYKNDSDGTIPSPEIPTETGPDPDVTKHIQDMYYQNKPQSEIDAYINSVKTGTEDPNFDYYKELAKQFSEGGQHIVDSVTAGAEKMTEGAAQTNLPGIGDKAEGALKFVAGGAQSFLGTFVGGLQTAFSPITPIVSKLIGDVAKNYKENPEVMGVVNKVAEPLDKLAQQHPEEAGVISDGINALLAVVGEKATGNIESPDLFKPKTPEITPGESVGTPISSEDLKGTLNRTIGGRNILSDNPDVVDVWQKEGAFPDIVDGANGKKILNTENAYNHLGEKISDIEDNELQPLLQGANKVSDMQPIDTIREEAIAKIKKEFKTSGNVDSGIAKVNKYFDDYQKSYGDFVSLSDVNDMKRGIRKSVNFNSDVVDQSVAYQMGQVFMKNIENSAKTLGLEDVGEINSRMAELIKAQDALEKLNGKPAPLKGWAKFKAYNPKSAAVIKTGASILGGEAVLKAGEMLSK